MNKRSLQIAMNEEYLKEVYKILYKAQGTFQLEGRKYTLADTITRILKEWVEERESSEESDEKEE